MIPIDIKNLVEVTLADGVVRHLRFSLGAKKRICEKFGNDPSKLLAIPPEELLPVVLLEGIVERDGITEDTLMEDLITSQMTEQVVFQFVDSFFERRVARNLRRVWEAVQLGGEQALQMLEKTKAEPPAIAPANTVQ